MTLPPTHTELPDAEPSREQSGASHADRLPPIAPQRISSARIISVACGVLVLVIIGLGSVLYLRLSNRPRGGSLTTLFGNGGPPAATTPSARNPEIAALIARGLKRERLDQAIKPGFRSDHMRPLRL